MFGFEYSIEYSNNVYHIKLNYIMVYYLNIQLNT